MDSNLFNLQRKITQYQEILKNTETYREVWKKSLKDYIHSNLSSISEKCNLNATIEGRTDLENLEAIVLSLGNVKSGVSQQVGDNFRRELVKHNGSLVYQQLFNGKVLVLINQPYLENYGRPQPPKTIGIYRPEEMNEHFFIRHLEAFIQEVMQWEDFDDENQDPRQGNQHIGFRLNFEKNQDEKKDGSVPLVP
jgi:hypothetical protein